LATPGKPIDAAGELLPAAIRRIPLAHPAIEVWLARLDLDARQVGQCASLLSRDEQLRAERYRFERDRRRFTVARGILRTLLGAHLELPPAAITFGYSENGKPFIADRASPIHFNASHSRERALYGIAKTCVLGVDIEYTNRDIDYNGLARRFFAPRECADLQRIPVAGRKRAFFACWTRKEAVIKATGDGLALPLDQFEVTVAPDSAPQILDFTVATRRVSDWALHAVDVGNDYVATVAAYRGK
jgi:4'-phosphopantetheinyl transferase